MLSALHTLIDMNLEHLLFLNSLPAITGLAFVLLVDDLARSATIAAGLLNLLDHRTHLSNNHANATTVASVAGPNCALFPSPTTTFRTYDIASESELGSLALVEVLESNMYAVDKIFSFPWAGWS